MPTLNSQLEALAHSFVNDVIAAIRGSSLDELLAPAGRTVRNGPSARRTAASTTESPAPKAARLSGRLHRRSAEEIAAMVGQIVELLRKNKDGLRAEQIREKLGLQAKEMPRILKAGLSAPKVLTSKGRKRATTYFAK
jgi:hypothetical protein